MRCSGIDALGKNPNRMVPEVVPADSEPAVVGARQELAPGNSRLLPVPVRISSSDFGLAAIAMADAGGPTSRAKTKKRKEDKDKAESKKPQPKDELPEEFLGQAIKDIVMHEVGHSLGLRHNFKASTMLSADQLNDTTITRAKGLVGSVMDYSPINIAPKGKKQGDLLHDHDRPLRLLGDRICLQADRRRRGDGAQEDRRPGPPSTTSVYATDEDIVFE